MGDLCHARVTKSMRYFPEALQLFEKLTDKAETENSRASRGALGVSLPVKALSARAGENGVLVYIEATAEHTQKRKQNAPLNGRTFYSYVASPLQELTSMRSTAFENHPLSLGAFLLSGIPQTETFSLAVKNMYLNTMSFLFYDWVVGTKVLAACAKARAKPAARPARKHFSL